MQRTTSVRKQGMSLSQRDKAYNYIRAQLMSGELRPGTRVSHRALAKEIGMSFIPVREAVGQLVSEGLFGHEPKLGSFVTEVSRQELAELYDLREALETHSVAKAAIQIKDADLAALQRHNDELKQIIAQCRSEERDSLDTERSDRWMVNDAGLHMTLLRAAGNRRAMKMVSDLKVMTQVFGHRNEERSLKYFERIVDEHQQLIEALKKHDAEEARRTLVHHLRAGCAAALENYDRKRLQDDLTPQSFTSAVQLRETLQNMEKNAK